MAQAEVHFYDHRSGEHAVVEGDHWYQESWWSQGDGSNDSVRTLLMYGQDWSKYLGSKFVLNLIAVEKIVCAEQVVYQEEVQYFPPIVITMLVVLDKMVRLESLCGNWQSQNLEELGLAIKDLKNQRKVLTQVTSESAVILIFDAVVAQVEKVFQAASTATYPTRIAEKVDDLEDRCFEFKQLVQAACGAFKKLRR